MPLKRKRHAARVLLPQYQWADYDDDRLLSLKFSSLRLRLRESLVWPDVKQLYADLERRGFGFRPHVWLSTEWFSPDGIPGFAMPFYVAHPRLLQLERKMMGEAEGGNRKWRMRILRHETGHAIDNAYALRRRADWRKRFGRASVPYRSDYSARPGSRRHVLHLGHWYAQSHPTEDFAETFAVWMQPKARWRREYADWPALDKLEFVDDIMAEIVAAPQKQSSRTVVDPLSELDITLREHYRRKVERYGAVERRFDQWLTRVFVPREKRPRGVKASRFVREIEPQLRRLLMRKARMHPYYIDNAIRIVRRRSRELDLVLRCPRQEARQQVVRLHERIVLQILQRNRENFAL